MLLQAAKCIGAGFATFWLAGAGIGIGNDSIFIIICFLKFNVNLKK